MLQAPLKFITQIEKLTPMQKEMILMNQETEENRKKLAEMIKDPKQMKKDILEQIEKIKQQKADRIAEITKSQARDGGGKREKKAFENMMQYKGMLSEAGGMDFDEAAN